MTENTNRKLDILRILMNIVLAYSVTLTAQMTYMQCGTGVRIRDLLIIVYVLAAELISTKFGNLIPVTAVHAAMLAAMWFMGPAPLEALARCVVGILIYAVSVKRGITHEKEFPPRAWWLIYGAVLYFYGTIVQADGVHTVAYIAEIMIVLLCCARYNEIALQTSLVGLGGTENIPFGRIRKINRVMLIFSMAVMGVLSAIVVLTDFGQNLLRVIKQGIIGGLRAIILWIYNHGWEASAYNPQTDTGAAQTDQVPSALQDLGGEASPFMERLSDIVMVICAVLIIAALVYMVYRAIRLIYLGYDRSRSGAKEKVEAVKPRKKESHAYASGAAAPLRFMDRSPSAKVRRLYIKYLKKGHDFAKVRKSYAPYDLEMTAYSVKSGKDRTGNMDEIHRLYEKARYQAQECSTQDSEKMKEALDRKA